MCPLTAEQKRRRFLGCLDRTSKPHESRRDRGLAVYASRVTPNSLFTRINFADECSPGDEETPIRNNTIKVFQRRKVVGEKQVNDFGSVKRSQSQIFGSFFLPIQTHRCLTLRGVLNLNNSLDGEKSAGPLQEPEIRFTYPLNSRATLQGKVRSGTAATRVELSFLIS